MMQKLKITFLTLLATTCVLAAETNTTDNSILNRAFTATNHEGVVIKEGRVTTIGPDYVLVLSAIGTNKVYFTNLPGSIQAEFAGLAAAQRLNSPDRAVRSNRRLFYQKLIADLVAKNDEEKIKAFGPIVQTCVDEMKKLNKEMMETEQAGKEAVAAEEKKMQLTNLAATTERDQQIAKVEADFAASRLTAQERDESLLGIKSKYLASYEQTQKDFSATKARLLQTVLNLGKDQRADYDELIKTLRRIQQEQEAVGKRLEQK
jgi:hypothetical protein